MEKTINRGDSLSISTTANPFGWLRDGYFDGVFIVGVAALALLSGWLSVANPRLFPVILFLDLWFLAYHHVVATFARLAFDVDHYREHKFLVTWLPLIVIGGTAAAAFAMGLWILATLYLYWQWFHYTRQAYGISRIYYRKANPAHPVSNVLEQLTIYTVPLYGILYRSWQSPDKFLGMELKFLPTPYWVVSVVGIASVVIVVCWLVNQFIAYRKGEMKPGYTLFMMSHLVVFMTGYIFINDINYGWLCLNVWHNAQYVMLVWMFNNSSFKSGVNPRHKFLSSISQTKNIHLYFTICIIVSTLIYISSSKMLGLLNFTSLPLAVVFYQAVNFHHYIVDGIIWKYRKQPLAA